MINYAYKIGEIAKNNGLIVACAESCTGGLVSSLLTDVSGSSEYIKINFVTYSNDAKMEFLGVQKATLDAFCAVSEQTSREMAQGLLKYADIGISTTGIAGPTGGSVEKPVGLMYASVAAKEFLYTHKVLLEPAIKRVDMKRFFAQETLKFTLEKLEEYYK